MEVASTGSEARTVKAWPLVMFHFLSLQDEPLQTKTIAAERDVLVSILAALSHGMARGSPELSLHVPPKRWTVPFRKMVS